MPAAIPTLAALMQRPDPLLSFKWACKNPTLPFGLPAIYLESVDVPWNNIKIGETIYGGGGYSNVAGSHSIGSVNLVLYEDQKMTTLQWVLAWKAKIKDFETGIYGLPGDGSEASTGYKQALPVQMLDTANTPLCTFLFTGIWPENTNNWTLSYTEDGRITVSQSFSVDDMFITFP